MVKLLLQGSTGSRTSESALLSIAVICVSITVPCCKENYVLPLSLRFRPPLWGAKGYKLMVRTGFSFLKLRIVTVPYCVYVRYSLVHSVNSLL